MAIDFADVLLQQEPEQAIQRLAELLEQEFEMNNPQIYFISTLNNSYILILNSIDAFKNQKKTGRKINLYTSVIAGGNRYQIEYSDNAGGLIQTKSHYRISDAQFRQYPEMPIKEMIFLPKVSSKKGLGSGWGLYLVRRAIDMHKGSIDLIDRRNGCTTRIVLPGSQD